MESRIRLEMQFEQLFLVISAKGCWNYFILVNVFKYMDTTN